MNPETRFVVEVANFDPSLKAVIESAGLHPGKACAAIKIGPDKKFLLPDRHRVFLHDGERQAEWAVPSLRELFRGQQSPPADLYKYPPEYVPLFAFIEKHALTACDALGDQPDREFEEVYANLRRRPDGRSLGPLHDFLWQVAALMLGKYVVSQAEYDGVLAALARSAQHWSVGLVSRNYIAYLRQGLGRIG